PMNQSTRQFFYSAFYKFYTLTTNKNGLEQCPGHFVLHAIKGVRKGAVRPYLGLIISGLLGICLFSLLGLIHKRVFLSTGNLSLLYLNALFFLTVLMLSYTGIRVNQTTYNYVFL